jgi:hypothetical protein
MSSSRAVPAELAGVEVAAVAAVLALRLLAVTRRRQRMELE